MFLFFFSTDNKSLCRKRGEPVFGKEGDPAATDKNTFLQGKHSCNSDPRRMIRLLQNKIPGNGPGIPDAATELVIPDLWQDPVARIIFPDRIGRKSLKKISFHTVFTGGIPAAESQRRLPEFFPGFRKQRVPLFPGDPIMARSLKQQQQHPYSQRHMQLQLPRP